MQSEQKILVPFGWFYVTFWANFTNLGTKFLDLKNCDNRPTPQRGSVFVAVCLHKIFIYFLKLGMEK